MTIQELLNNPDKPRRKARELVNMAVKHISNEDLCLADLADSFNLTAGLDEMEAMISEADYSTLMSELIAIAQDIAEQLLKEDGFEFLDANLID